jgi:hypothetical protein
MTSWACLLVLAAGSDKPAAVVKPSAFTWGYFYAPAERASVAGLAGGRKESLTVYRVEKVVSVTGKAGVDLKKGATLIRLETPSKLPDGAKPPLLFRGVPRHLEYTTAKQKEELKGSRPELPAGKDTAAVIIPIRKNAAWWALPHDERNAFFHKKGDRKGHTAIGAEYVDRIYRKLYHARYVADNPDHDFITYFEFKREHESDFRALLKKLRDVKLNPEWKFVDREYEIWLTKAE